MYDLLIRNGTVIDGSGSEGFRADVAIENGKITAIGTELGEAARVIDALGLVVTPGFIDSHSHADNAMLKFPQQIEKVEQGITTNVGGQCGSTPYPARENGTVVTMGDFLARAKEIPQGSNLITFVGHSALRKAVMGMEARPAEPEELEQMKDLLREAMAAGALGVSFGLIYTPGCYAPTEELVELARVAKEEGGMISAHIRGEADCLIEAVEEFITVVKRSGARGVLSHHKAAQFRNHGKVKITLGMLEQAIAEGCDLYCDVYPYTASRTSLSATFVPKEFRDGKLSEHLKNNASLREQIKKNGQEKRGNDLSWVLLTSCTAYPAYSGLNLNEAAQLHGKDVWDTLLDIMERQPSCGACFFSMCEEDVETVLAWDRAMVCTDSSVVRNTAYHHPRLRGSFPRVLGRYVRERGVTTLPEMIRKMTSLPASVYGLQEKGLLRVGYDADLCIFDPERIIDRATYTETFHRAEGLSWVIVGGEIAAENAVFMGKTAGKLLLRKKAL